MHKNGYRYMFVDIKQSKSSLSVYIQEYLLYHIEMKLKQCKENLDFYHITKIGEKMKLKI